VGRAVLHPDVPDHGNVITDHFDTYRGESGRVLWKTALLQVAVPTAVGCIVGGFEVHLRGTAELIAGVSVLAGLLFALVIYVFQLGIDVSKSAKALPKRLPRLIDELFRNVLYAVASSVALLLVLVVARQFEVESGDAAGLPVVWSVSVAILGTHLLAVVGQCVKRTRRAYIELRPRLGRTAA
jgi:hypothetical protein